MKLPYWARVLSFALLLAAAPAHAVDPPKLAVVPANPTGTLAALDTSQVDAFMAQRGGALVWFRAGGGAEAASLLAQILRRARLDGLSSGPALAEAVESAARNAAGGDSVAAAQADRTMSGAWLAYVAALSTPLPGFTYSDPSLAPPTFNPLVTLNRAATAPSITAHLTAVSAVNPIYAQMRDAAWEEMKHNAAALPDDRLLTNLARARVLPSTGRYLIVNSATQQLLIVENGGVVDQMKVIVGRRDAQTPMLASTIWYATLNPYWYVPPDLTQKIVAKKMQRPSAAAYWKEKRFEIIADLSPDPAVLPLSGVDWKAVAAGTQAVYVRQLPGPGNSMGKMKFTFPNDIGVYLHDTDLPQLFAVKPRTLSNGCIRLEDAKRLGRWLMGRDPTTDSTAPEQHVVLQSGVPIFLTYLTAQLGDGKLNFVADVYRRDPVGPSPITRKAGPRRSAELGASANEKSATSQQTPDSSKRPL